MIVTSFQSFQSPYNEGTKYISIFIFLSSFKRTTFEFFRNGVDAPLSNLVSLRETGEKIRLRLLLAKTTTNAWEETREGMLP